MDELKSSLAAKAEEFLETRKHFNNLYEIVQSLDNGDTCLEAIHVILLIFGEVLQRRTMLHKNENEVSKYVNDVKNLYDETWRKLLELLSIEKFCEPALNTLFGLLAQEGKFPVIAPKKGHYYFPCDRLKMIIRKCFSTESHFESVQNKIDEYTNFIDVVYYFWLITPKLLSKLNNPSGKQISQILTILQLVPIPSEEELADFQEEVLLCYSKNKAKFKPKYTSLQESIQNLWFIISRWKLQVRGSSVHKQILILLIESILSHLLKPVLTLDYLMESLEAGGSVSVLALQGIFTLVKDHNLEYPNIYAKLYSFFHRSIFYAKYKSRLYVLTNIFLSSTHVPETLVASFIKRFARLCLYAPPQDIIVLSTFIGNLLIRHPSLKVLIQHPIEKTVSSDPFQENELDPLKTNAIESSLWELETLQQHVLPKVSKAVSFINKPLPTVEWDLTELFDATYNEVYEKASSRKFQKVSLTFEKPKSLGLPRTSYFSEIWS